MSADSGRVFPQSAAIPYIRTSSSLQIVLITNSSRTAWIYPKGLIEPGMTPTESAANEAYEEAGVLGQIEANPIDEYHDEKWGGVCHVQVYALKVDEILSDWDEKGFRERIILPFSEALRQVKPVQRRGIERLQDRLVTRDPSINEEP